MSESLRDCLNSIPVFVSDFSEVLTHHTFAGKQFAKATLSHRK
jgi:hypothetical protein